MRRLLVVLGILTPLLLLAGICPAQERHRPSTRAARMAQRAAAAAATARAPAEASPVPVVSQDVRWVRSVLIGIGVLVLAGVVVGPVYRAWVTEEMLPVHAHDEPPGASHRHGPGGERTRGIDE